MKTLIVYLIVMTLGGSSVYGQYLLGLNEEGVKEKAKEFGNNSNLTFRKTWYNGSYALHWYDDQVECKVMVTFNPYTDLSVVTTLSPVDNEVFNAITKGFEDMHFKKNKDGWDARVEGKVLKIEVVEFKGKKNLVFREIMPNELE